MAGQLPSTSSLSEELSSELEALASIYSGDGEFIQETPEEMESSSYQCVVNIKPTSMSTGLKLSIPDSYPDKCPKIELLLPDDDNDQTTTDSILAELLQHLYQTASENKGAPMCFVLAEAAKDWLVEREAAASNEQEISTNEETDIAKSTKESNGEIDDEEEDNDETDHHRNKKKGKGRKKLQVEEEKVKGKKPRMKTATEVIHRILWDEQLCEDHFVIGYLDRFLGVMERPFADFSWEDIASVDYDVLAIPKHRIQYFKYKDDVVWDKTIRFDDVFGSTGSKTTILDVIEKYQKENESKEEKESDESVDGDDPSDYVESDSQETEGSTGTTKGRSNRPNYFVAIRINNPDIVEQVEHLQNELCEADISLEDTRTTLKQLHVTLCTLRLDTPGEMERAIAVLKEEQSNLKRMLSPATLLRFKGLQTFHDRVLCSVPEYNPVIMTLVDYLCSAIDNAGLCIVGTPHVFTPHLTVLKITRKQIKQGARGYLDQRLYKDHIDTEFGVQNVDCIHLCSMLDAPRADGFYYSLASVDVSPEN